MESANHSFVLHTTVTATGLFTSPCTPQYPLLETGSKTYRTWSFHVWYLHLKLPLGKDKRAASHSSPSWTITGLGTQTAASLPASFYFFQHRGGCVSRSDCPGGFCIALPKLGHNAQGWSRSPAVAGKTPLRRRGLRLCDGGRRWGQGSAAAPTQLLPRGGGGGGGAGALCPLRAAIGTAVRTAPRPPAGVSGQTGWASAAAPTKARGGSAGQGLRARGGGTPRGAQGCGRGRDPRLKKEKRRRSELGWAFPRPAGGSGRGSTEPPAGAPRAAGGERPPGPCGREGAPRSERSADAVSPRSMLAIARRRCSSVTSSPMTTSR